MNKPIKVSPTGQTNFMGCFLILFLIAAGLVIVVLMLSEIIFEDSFSIPGIIISFLVLVAIPVGISKLLPTSTYFYYDEQGFYQKFAKHKNLYNNTYLTIYLKEKYKDIDHQELYQKSDYIVDFVRVDIRGKSEVNNQFWDNGVSNFKPLIKLLLKSVPSKNVNYKIYESHYRGDVGLSITTPDGETEWIG